MLEHFTEDEIERMSSFTETPAYERTPEQLLPEDADDDTSGNGSHTSRSGQSTE